MKATMSSLCRVLLWFHLGGGPCAQYVCSVCCTSSCWPPWFALVCFTLQAPVFLCVQWIVSVTIAFSMPFVWSDLLWTILRILHIRKDTCYSTSYRSQATGQYSGFDATKCSTLVMLILCLWSETELKVIADKVWVSQRSTISEKVRSMMLSWSEHTVFQSRSISALTLW